MKNLLVGNGINIQFNKTDYTSQQIVLRVLKNCAREDFPSDIIIDRPYLLRNYFGFLFLEAREIIRGKYDNLVLASSEKNSLITFKKLYSDKINTLKITDIGFEDYYLLHDLFCHKNNIQNSEKFVIRESMRRAYLYSIFNDGKLNELYKNYPKMLINYLISFDNIFTTNYDSNIELATGKEIFHIHGQFDKRSDIYNESSLRNQLPDAPVKECEINEIYFYLYSNALSTYCGEYKEFQLKRYSQANKGIEKMALAYSTNSETKKEVDNWTKNTNALIAKLGCAIQLKAFNPSLAFSDDYHFDKFKSISGLLEIIGLSPWNDFHIFESINMADLDECVYYFFAEYECDVIKSLLPTLNKQKNLYLNQLRHFGRNTMKNKTVIKSQEEFERWIRISNLFVKSAILPNEALKQFNKLNSTQRLKIQQYFGECDKTKSKIPKDEIDAIWEVSIMVDAHIIATEFNIDPLTAAMCIHPPCKNYERIYFTKT